MVDSSYRMPSEKISMLTIRRSSTRSRINFAFLLEDPSEIFTPRLRSSASVSRTSCCSAVRSPTVMAAAIPE